MSGKVSAGNLSFALSIVAATFGMNAIIINFLDLRDALSSKTVCYC